MVCSLLACPTMSCIFLASFAFIINICSVAVNGGWSLWTSWSVCSVTCGSGQRTRQRTCNNPLSSDGGSDCAGDSSDQQTCTSPTDCPG